MILSRFRWYRRMRGGYWASVTAPLGIFNKTKWVRSGVSQPTPDGVWEYYPWAKKTLGNGYIDEWHSVEPFYAVPLSTLYVKAMETIQDASDSIRGFPQLNGLQTRLESVLTELQKKQP